jgi:hypothetical protein
MRTETTGRRSVRTAATWGAALAAMVLAVTTAAPARAVVSETTSTCVETDGRISAMAATGGVVYMGGDFTRVRTTGGTWVTRTRLAAVNMSTCALMSWAPRANAAVNAIYISGASVYLAGAFTTINGLARQRVAAVRTSDGVLYTLNPRPDGEVRSMAAVGGLLYLGGDFSFVGTTARSKLAAVSMSTGKLSSWRPVANGNVEAVRPSADGKRLYVGGRFTALAGSSSAAYLGAVSPTTGALVTTFLPRPGWPVEALGADSRAVYAAGGGEGGHLALYSATGARIGPLHVTDGDVQALAVDGDTVYAGGHFGAVCSGGTGGGTPFTCSTPIDRRKLFAVSVSTGSLLGWSPDLDSSLGVWALRVNPTAHHLWAGGDFTTVNTRSLQHLAVFR